MLTLRSVSGPNTIIHLNRIMNFEWCVVMCGYNNMQQRGTCSTKIGLHAQNLFIIPGSNIHTMRDLHVHPRIYKFFKLMMDLKIFTCQALEITKEILVATLILT